MVCDLRAPNCSRGRKTPVLPFQFTSSRADRVKASAAAAAQSAANPNSERVTARLSRCVETPITQGLGKSSPRVHAALLAEQCFKGAGRIEGAGASCQGFVRCSSHQGLAECAPDAARQTGIGGELAIPVNRHLDGFNEPAFGKFLKRSLARWRQQSRANFARGIGILRGAPGHSSQNSLLSPMGAPPSD